LRLRPLWAHSLFQFRRKLRHWLAQVSPRKLLRLMRSRWSKFTVVITVAGIGAIAVMGTVVMGTVVITGRTTVAFMAAGMDTDIRTAGIAGPESISASVSKQSFV
jgi:hypothetical protein